MPNPQIALDNFERNLESVAKLMSFDDQLIDVILPALRSHRAKLEKSERVGKHLYPDGIIRTLETIRENASLKAHYQALYNQWLVFLVSYFASAVKELFIEAAAKAIEQKQGTALLAEEIKASIAELADAKEDTSRFLAELLSAKEGMSFQDMQSIVRSFTNYFGFNGVRDACVNDIIAAQACRHALVHSGGIIDKRLVNQVRGASPRNVLTDLRLGESVSVSHVDVERTAQSMREYLGRLLHATESRDP